MGVSALELRRRVLMAQPHKERKTGGIVSFNTHVPQVLGVTVPLSPVQAGTGDPYPPGGGINLVDVQDVSGIKSQTQIKAGISLPAGTYTISAYIANSGTAGAALRVINGSSSLKTIGYSYTPTLTRFSGQFTLESATEDLKLSVVGNASGYDASVSQVQIEKGSTAHDFAPYSNIRPISGHTGAAVGRTGKNLLPNKKYQYTATQVRLGGENSAEAYKKLKAGTYTLSVTGNVNVQCYYTHNGVSKLLGSNGGTLIVTEADEDNSYCFYCYKSGSLSADDILSWQLEPGTTASEYAPYSGESFPFTFPATWKNLIDDSQKVKSGSSIFIGTETANTPGITLPPGTYTVAFVITANLQRNMYAKDADTGEGIPGFPSYQAYSTSPAVVTFTLTKQTRMILWTYNTSYTSASDVISVMLNEGSTALPYEPYTNTVYGGRLEPAAGVLKVETAIVDLGSVNWGLNTAGNQEFMFSNGIRDFVKRPSASFVIVNIICSSLATVSAYSIYMGTSKQGIGIHIDGSIRAVYPNMPTDSTQFRQAVTGWKLVYELAEPLIIPLTPAEIRALMGENNVFADTGDVDVEFWTN